MILLTVVNQVRCQTKDVFIRFDTNNFNIVNVVGVNKFYA